mmetsp:Transcript_2461/g.4755  ORF Transcript_2461/g.4755 Transcript_2461/m.4755 type:complete len:85 (-) Transcript_2461:442-696(-)
MQVCLAAHACLSVSRCRSFPLVLSTTISTTLTHACPAIDFHDATQKAFRVVFGSEPTPSQQAELSGVCFTHNLRALGESEMQTE